MFLDHLNSIHNNITSPIRDIVLDIGIILGIPLAILKHISSEYKKAIEGVYELNKADTKAGVNGSTQSSAFVHNKMIIEEKYKPPPYLFFLTPLAKKKVKKRNLEAIKILKKRSK